MCLCTGSSQSVPAGMSQRSIRLSCDRHLLAAAHTAITLSPLLAVLKVTQALLSLAIVGDLFHILCHIKLISLIFCRQC